MHYYDKEMLVNQWLENDIHYLTSNFLHAHITSAFISL